MIYVYSSEKSLSFQRHNCGMKVKAIHMAWITASLVNTTDYGEGRYITWAKTSESVPIVAKGVRHVCEGTTIDFCP